MKVAFLSGSTHKIPRLGGEARIYFMAKCLAASGIQVDLFGSTFSDELIGPNMSQSRSFRGWSGGDWYPISARGIPTVVKNAPSLVHQNSVLQGYDAIISELGSAWQGLCLKPVNRLPMVLNEHNVEWHLMRQQEQSLGRPFPWRRLRVYEKVCHATFDNVVVVSELDRDIFEADGTPGRKITVVPNGVDLDTFSPAAGPRREVRARYQLEEETPLLMYMGSMKFFPNVDAVSSLLDVIYPRARTLVPNLRLMLTGPGYEDAKVSIPKDVILTGSVEHFSMPPYINASDICVAPLRYGSGTRHKIIEWMACGKPIIATRKAVEGIEVTSGDNLILEDNLDQYPSLISNLWRDPLLRNRLGENARVFVEKTYGWEACVAPLERFLRSV
ncbi:MAG: glycosyltransferase family 4 protein [Thaumarchaeota archaeon]|nr:glycosyltransferase family 4 protein [Nitrososphaerota archaeon]